ncbi:MAG TPA: asparagine synthase-related protein, partial [Acidimicrobiales bacterium]|nr:asparagine synthase-related protein [Acidimicrobiales bacterium]
AYRLWLQAQRYHALPAMARATVNKVARHVPPTLLGHGGARAGWARSVVRFSELPEEEAFLTSNSLFAQPELAALLSPELWPDIDDLLGEHLEIYSDNYLDDAINRMCLADVRFLLPARKLACADGAGMASSVEVRLPFVDPVVFRAAFSLSGDHKVGPVSTKMALQEVGRAWLPARALRRARPSSLPLKSWARKELRPLVDEVLLQGELVRSGFLQSEALQDLVRQGTTGEKDNSKQIWQLLSLELWYRQADGAGVSL